MFYNGSNEYTDIYNISIGQTPSLSFSFEQEGCSGCLIFGMNETLDYTNLNKNVEGYYYQQYTATDRFGRYDLVYRVVIKVGNPLPGVNYPSEHIKYNYSDDWLDQLSNYETLTYNADGTTNTQSTVQSYTYDNQGNPTEITNFIYNDTEYHHAELNYDGRQLNEINIYTSSQSMTYTISYTYNDQGYRTSKTVDGLTTVYHLQGDKVLLESSNEYDIIYTYDYDGKLISFYYESDSNGINDGEYFYIRNQQDDITKIVNENGTIVVEYMYDAWGNLLEIKGSLKDSIGIDNPYRYRGYRYDEEISMYYLNSRFYDANIGRFINSDGLMGQQGNILGHNMYAYTQNNPVMYVDPSGMSPETNGIISLVYKEAYKSPSANFYLFDYGGIDYKTKGRLLSNQTTIIELYALTTFSGFGAPFMTTSVGGRVNFDKLSLYSSISLTSVNYGFATESGYGSFSVGMVGQTIFDVGVGITFEANNQYINIKAPLSLILVVSLSPAAAFVTATAAVVITMVELMNKEGE